jgi:hypothetical protein
VFFVRQACWASSAFGTSSRVVAISYRFLVVVARTWFCYRRDALQPFGAAIAVEFGPLGDAGSPRAATIQSRYCSITTHMASRVAQGEGGGGDRHADKLVHGSSNLR